MKYPHRLLAENHADIQERNKVFKRFGYDIEGSMHYILSRALPLRGRILEIGTGKGRFLCALARKAKHVTTVDIDPVEQRCARMNTAWEGIGPKIRFVVQDAGHLKFRSGSFDTVVSVNALHHMRNPLAAVREMVRVMKPGGKIVISDLDRSGFRIFNRIHGAEGRAHPRGRSQFGDIAGFLRALGMRIRRHRGKHQEVLIAG